MVPFETCAVHVTMDTHKLGLHGDRIGTVDGTCLATSFSVCPAHGALGAFGIGSRCDEKRQPTLPNLSQNGISQTLPLLPTRKVFKSSYLWVLCPRKRFKLGFHVQIQQLFDDVVHHADQFLTVVTEQPEVVGPTSSRATCAHCRVCPPKENPQPLARHFSSAFQSTCLAMRPHSTGVSTPLWRTHREYQNSVAQFKKSHSSRNPRTSCPGGVP